MPDPERLFRLLYVSETRLDGDIAQAAQEIERILATSRRNNAAFGITGALIFNCGFFAQVLEGPRGAVEQIFQTIRHDPRHAKIQVMSAGEVDSRTFPNWAMAFIGNSPSWANALGWIKDATRFQPEQRRDRLFDIVMEMARDAELSADRSYSDPADS